MGIEKYIGEATEYDKKLKLEIRKPKSWLKSVSAFANGIGGTLIFGVADDGTIVGLSNAQKDSEKISEILKVRMDPIPNIVMEILSENGKEFILLKVLPGQETPYYYFGEGNRIAFVRVGNESVPADATALKRLVLKGANLSYDSMSSVYKFEDYAFTKLRTVYRKQTGSEFEENDFISFELVDKEGSLTNAGALLADESPIRQSRLFCTRWNGLDKASGVMEAWDDKEYEGSLISLLQNGTEFVKNNSKKRWKKTGSGRVEMPDYPEQAVHEALVNALIHRDYTEIGSEVHIDMFDDRLEIYSPGGMLDGTLVQQLDTDRVASKRRNPIIADVFSRMHFMDRRGSGFRKIKADYRNAVNYSEKLEPVFESDSNAFYVILFNLNYGTEVENPDFEQKNLDFEAENLDFRTKKLDFERYVSGLKLNQPTKDNILIMFNEYGFDKPFSRTDIVEYTELSLASASVLINKMKQFELIEAACDQGRGRYKFKER